MFNLLAILLTAYATLASAKTVTYNFDIGWVTVGSFQATAVQANADQHRLHQMDSPDKSLVSMANGRTLNLSHISANAHSY